MMNDVWDLNFKLDVEISRFFSRPYWRSRLCYSVASVSLWRYMFCG